MKIYAVKVQYPDSEVQWAVSNEETGYHNYGIQDYPWTIVDPDMAQYFYNWVKEHSPLAEVTLITFVEVT